MLGILAGMGPRSTAPFIEQVVEQCQLIYGADFDEQFPPMMIHSCPTPFRVSGETNHQAMKTSILKGIKILELVKPSIIAMPCNSAHCYIHYLQSHCNIPILNMVEIAVRKLNTKRVAVLATESTMNSMIYQAACDAHNIQLLDHTLWQHDLNITISLIKQGKNTEAKDYYRKVLEIVSDFNIKELVIACTDITTLCHSKSEFKVIDAGRCLAKELVHHYVIKYLS